MENNTYRTTTAKVNFMDITSDPSNSYFDDEVNTQTIDLAMVHKNHPLSYLIVLIQNRVSRICRESSHSHHLQRRLQDFLNTIAPAFQAIDNKESEDTFLDPGLVMDDALSQTRSLMNLPNTLSRFLKEVKECDPFDFRIQIHGVPRDTITYNEMMEAIDLFRYTDVIFDIKGIKEFWVNSNKPLFYKIAKQ